MKFFFKFSQLTPGPMMAIELALARSVRTVFYKVKRNAGLN